MIEQRAERWLGPEPSVILKSFLIALGAMTAGLLATGLQAIVTLPIYGHFVIVRGQAETGAFSSPVNYAILIVSAIFLAPVLETLAIVAIPYYLLARWAGVRAFLLAETLLAVGLHYRLSASSLVNIATMFFCLGCQYALWNRLRGWRVAFCGVVLTHGFLNVLAYPVAVAIDAVASMV
jgi:hypothetical protein